jgi:hypothetical protein
MGIDAAYFRNDQDLGIGIGNFANEMSSLFVTEDGHAPFADEAILEGFGPASRLALTFGLFSSTMTSTAASISSRPTAIWKRDQRRAAQPDLCSAGAAVLELRRRLRPVRPGGCRRRPVLPMVGRGRLRRHRRRRRPGYRGGTKRPARCPVSNDQHLGHHWLRVKLEGRSVNRNAIGAMLVLTADGVAQRRLVMPTRSYLSQVELPVTFGLGEAEGVDALSVAWPNGQVQEVPVAQIDTTLTITQPAGE